MHRFQGKYRIPTARLKEWDYAAAGYYYVTLCTAGHQPFFGEITDGEMRFSEVGEVAYEFWLEIPAHFSHVELDEFIIMPNHIHGIVVINEHATVVETQPLLRGGRGLRHAAPARRNLQGLYQKTNLHPDLYLQSFVRINLR